METRTEYLVQKTQIVEIGEPWGCAGCGHVLGMVKTGIDGVRRLHYHNAIIEGEAEITCPVCRSGRTWHFGQDAMDRLLKARKERQVRLDRAIAELKAILVE